MHLALSVGMAVLAVFIYRLYGTLRIDAMESNRILVYLVPIAALVGYFAGIFIFQRMLRPLKVSTPLHVRLLRFQSASLLQYACIEIAALIALYAFLAEGFIFYLAIAGFMIIYLFSRRPNRKMLRKAIPLSPAEESQVFD